MRAWIMMCVPCTVLGIICPSPKTHVPGDADTCIADCTDTIEPWQYWSSRTASACRVRNCQRLSNQYYTETSACQCSGRLTDSACPKANCNNLANDEYWSGSNGFQNVMTNPTMCYKAKCTNAFYFQYYSGPSGDAARFTISSCPVEICTNAANNQYYPIAGFVAAPTTNNCRVLNCTGSLPHGYYWSTPGYGYSNTCGWGPCNPKPLNSTFRKDGFFLSAECPWTCDRLFYREGALCKSCPPGTSSEAGAVQCTTCDRQAARMDVAYESRPDTAILL